MRCYKCQRYNHLQARCIHSVRCCVCSQPNPTEDCTGRLNANEPTTAKYPNCWKKHHAWNLQCPERLHERPRSRQSQQHQTPGGGPRQERNHPFVPVRPPARPAWERRSLPIGPIPRKLRLCEEERVRPREQQQQQQPQAAPRGPQPQRQQGKVSRGHSQTRQ